MNGCATPTSPRLTNTSELVIRSLPQFPLPSPEIADELVEVCPEHKCVALYDWLRKLKILQEQLALYKVDKNG